jgi:hypothetical protein
MNPVVSKLNAMYAPLHALSAMQPPASHSSTHVDLPAPSAPVRIAPRDVVVLLLGGVGIGLGLGFAAALVLLG